MSEESRLYPTLVYLPRKEEKEKIVHYCSLANGKLIEVKEMDCTPHQAVFGKQENKTNKKKEKGKWKKKNKNESNWVTFYGLIS